MSGGKIVHPINHLIPTRDGQEIETKRMGRRHGFSSSSEYSLFNGLACKKKGWALAQPCLLHELKIN